MSDIMEIVNLSMDMAKMNKQFYESTPIKRKRRTKSDMKALQSNLYGILSEDHPQTVRGVFYQATVLGVVDKTENEYKAIQRNLADMRKAGNLPFDWIADSTRWMRKPRTYSGLEAALRSSWKFYRRSIWNDQNDYVEIWMEKDALAGVIYPVTDKWDVPLMVTRGYSSLSFLHVSAEYINALGKPTYIYCLGDYDPSGVDISRNIEKGLRQFAPDAQIHFQRIAVTPVQIEDWNLPTRPTKKTDTRSKNFKGESVELDAIPARMLRALVNVHIEIHVRDEVLRRTKMAEDAERKTLENVYHDYRSMIY
jgi:hypothetical protein